MSTTHLHAFGSRGDGPPALLLHGNPDTGAIWEPVVTRLQDRLCCHVPDLPGFGRTPSPTWPITLPNLAGWVASLLDELGVNEPVHLIAHDFGGPFAGAFAVLHPERVATITLANTLFSEGHRWHRWARIWRTPVLGELAMALTSYPIFRAEVRRGGPGLSEEQIRAAWEASQTTDRQHVLRLYRAHPPDVFEQPVPGRDLSWARAWRAVAAERPSQVIWGVQDPYLASDGPEKLAPRRIVRIEEAGHWVQAEAPDRFAEAVGAWVAPHPAP